MESEQTDKAATEEKHVPRCLLCGDRCWFEDQSGSRAWAVCLLAVGWLLPVVLVGCLSGEPGGELLGSLLGSLIWLGTVAYLLFRQTAWVCRTCGAIYPARKVVRDDKVASVAQPDDQEKAEEA